jgi:hypothetical protein
MLAARIWPGQPASLILSRGDLEDEAADGILAAARFQDAPRAHPLAAACAGLACVLPKSPGPALASTHVRMVLAGLATRGQLLAAEVRQYSFRERKVRHG